MRAMTAADVARVHALEKALYPVDAWSKGQFEEELAAVPATRYYIVEEVQGQIIAYAGVMVVGEHADIQTLSVAASHQRQGWGATMLTELEREASARGASAIFLEVRIDNQPAISLYEKSGYHQLGIRENYYAPGVDALVMRKVLP